MQLIPAREGEISVFRWPGLGKSVTLRQVSCPGVGDNTNGLHVFLCVLFVSHFDNFCCISFYLFWFSFLVVVFFFERENEVG